jgi:large subunit ribosomal protein L13e
MRGTLLPVHQRVRREKARAVTEEERKMDLYRHVRRVRADKRMKGKREKKAKDAADKV